MAKAHVGLIVNELRVSAPQPNIAANRSCQTPENELLKFWSGAALRIRNRDR